MKNKIFCGAYSIFLGKMLETKAETVLTLGMDKKLFHFGESHCLSYAHQSIALAGSYFQIEPRITFGAKAFHFSQNRQNSYKAITATNFKSLPSGSKIFLSYGEIDCRPSEGFISAARKLKKPIEQLVDNTVVGYVRWFFEQNKARHHYLYFINVPAPVYDKMITTELNSELVRTIELFNTALKKHSRQHGFDTIDVHRFTVGHDGF
jgi:hypothetical protein